MRTAKQNIEINIMVFITDSSDHIAGKEELNLTISISKNGGPFVIIDPIIIDRGSGWYNIALTSDMTDTLGDLAFHITALEADPTDLLFVVDNCNVELSILVNNLIKITNNNVIKSGDIVTIYDNDGETIWKQYDLSAGGRIQI